MSQPGAERIHLYGADQRSLCDRSVIGDVTSDTPPEGAKVCGGCVMIAQVLIQEAKDLIWLYGEPEPGFEAALDELAQPGSRWRTEMDLAGLKEEYRRINYRYPWFVEGANEVRDVSQGPVPEGAK